MIKTTEPLSTYRPSTSEGFWSGKLGYAQAWVTCFTALTMGVALHLMAGAVPSSPEVLLFLSLPLVAAALFVRIQRHSPVAQWIAGIPLAVTSTSLGLVLALAGGVIPVSTWNKLGLPSLWSSWPFVMISLVVMTSLAASSSKRAYPLTRQNVLFLLSHLGLLIVMAGGAMSSVFMDRSRLAVFEGVFVDKAQDEAGNDIKLPFSVRLEKFVLENFPPTLAVASTEKDVKAGSKFCAVGMEEKIAGWTVKVEKFISKAIYSGETFVASPWKTAAPAAYVRATSPGQESAEGWVCPGSLEVPVAMLPLTEKHMLAMPELRPKKFRSSVTIKEGQKQSSADIEVNMPAKVGPYQVYQVSYDEKMGAASEYSVLEVVEDKGLPFVYLGLFMVLTSSAWHLWEGVGKSK